MKDCNNPFGNLFHETKEFLSENPFREDCRAGCDHGQDGGGDHGHQGDVSHPPSAVHSGAQVDLLRTPQ